MKKRNKPIFLVTFLVIMISGLAIMSFPRDLLKGPPAPKTGADVDVPDKDSIGKDVASQMGGSKVPDAAKRRKMTMSPDAVGGENAGPSIALPKAPVYKPKPNDSSTSTQWYSDETPKSLPKDN